VQGVGINHRWAVNVSGQASAPSAQTTSFRAPVLLGVYGPGGHNANTDGGQPIPILRWSVDLHESAQHKENLERTLRKQLAERRAHLVPTRAPISSGDLIFLPTYDQRILAIDAKSGKIRWPIVFSGSPLGYSIDRGSNRDSYALGLPAPDYLVRRVWGDFATSQISTDGKRIFGLSGSSAAD
jgi:hypothetical protein